MPETVSVVWTTCVFLMSVLLPRDARLHGRVGQRDEKVRAGGAFTPSSVRFAIPIAKATSDHHMKRVITQLVRFTYFAGNHT